MNRLIHIGLACWILSAAVPLEAATPAPIRLEWIGDVAAAESDLAFGPSGRDILVFGGVPVASKTEEKASFARWLAGPEPGRVSLAVKMVLSVEPGSTTITITSAPDSDGVWRVGGRMADDGRARAARGLQDLSAQGRAEDAAFRTPDGVRFEDGAGDPVVPDMQLHTGDRLFSVDGPARVEITEAGDRDARVVSHFSYDPVSRRVLTYNGLKSVLYDLRIRRKSFLVAFDRQTHRRFQYHLIPGHNALLLYEYIETEQDPQNGRLYLCSLDGERTWRVSLQNRPDGKGEHLPVESSIVCSRYLVAYAYPYPHPSLVRVYAIRSGSP